MALSPTLGPPYLPFIHRRRRERVGEGRGVIANLAIWEEMVKVRVIGLGLGLWGTSGYRVIGSVGQLAVWDFVRWGIWLLWDVRRLGVPVFRGYRRMPRLEAVRLSSR